MTTYVYIIDTEVNTHIYTFDGIATSWANGGLYTCGSLDAAYADKRMRARTCACMHRLVCACATLSV